MAMELQVKVFAHEYFYLKGLVVLLSYQNFWVWWCYESELVSSIHSYWRKQKFLWCQRCKMTSSLPANQHHEISMLALDESHDSQSAVLSPINNFLLFFFYERAKHNNYSSLSVFATSLQNCWLKRVNLAIFSFSWPITSASPCRHSFSISGFTSGTVFLFFEHWRLNIRR